MSMPPVLEFQRRDWSTIPVDIIGDGIDWQMIYERRKRFR